MEAATTQSTPNPGVIDEPLQLRGSIDMIERHRKTNFLRVTDHRPADRRACRPAVWTAARFLQPVISDLR